MLRPFDTIYFALKSSIKQPPAADELRDLGSVTYNYLFDGFRDNSRGNRRCWLFRRRNVDGKGAGFLVLRNLESSAGAGIGNVEKKRIFFPRLRGEKGICFGACRAFFLELKLS